LCDVAPLEVCDVLLGQPYLWKHHVVYESRPRSVIITLDKKLYRIPEVVPPTAISLISAKQCRKVISQTGKFVFFVIHAQSEWKVAATSMASVTGLSMQQKQVDKVVEEYKDIFSSPTRVPLHCQVKHSIDLTPVHCYPMGQSITTLCQKMRKSSTRSKSCSKRGTSDQAHHLVEAQSCLCRRKTGPGDSALITGP
jgi:hypothetical protein